MCDGLIQSLRDHLKLLTDPPDDQRNFTDEFFSLDASNTRQVSMLRDAYICIYIAVKQTSDSTT